MSHFYRNIVSTKGLVAFSVHIDETDLHILAESRLTDLARKAVETVRAAVLQYISIHPEFKKTLIPIDVDVGAPDIVKRMANAAHLAGTGPMAAVAGAIAEHVGRRLLRRSTEVIVENGGDIFILSRVQRIIAVYAGSSSLSMKFGLRLDPAPDGIGICTSSATVGHSLSFGKADAVVISADECALADAVATATCNRVTLPSSLEPALTFACGIAGVRGAVIILDDTIAAAGSGFELIEL